MNISVLDQLNAAGHLTISKVYKNGSEELIFDDKNVIVSGFGWSLAHFFSRLGAQSISEFQIDRFQLGVSGHTANQVSSTFELSGPLTEDDYLDDLLDSNLYVFSAHQIKNNSVVTSPTTYFAQIPYSKVTRINETSVRYTIFIDEDSCNEISRNGNDAYLNEIGLFIKNPLGRSPDASILAAYKYFTNIRKTSDFGIIFRWTLTFG